MNCFSGRNYSNLGVASGLVRQSEIMADSWFASHHRCYWTAKNTAIRQGCAGHWPKLPRRLPNCYCRSFCVLLRVKRGFAQIRIKLDFLIEPNLFTFSLDSTFRSGCELAGGLLIPSNSQLRSVSAVRTFHPFSHSTPLSHGRSPCWNLWPLIENTLQSAERWALPMRLVLSLCLDSQSRRR